ncbi:PAS domain-containing sensor histidine kinase [Calothrix sp. 336/3]|uniref:PAS domain-containing sensor histidine kinase n=1 Tax=Calothrix sp. 336/3 TaxID=1337936 RepID=UPI0004E2F01F|nr:ATP-binding protein [Calothrix sp. 336/3]AKG20856.1 histidine kinase [Calothrix sp. 336/3]
MKPEFLADNELHTQIQYRLIEQISESERRYRELVENLREIVFKCDKHGNITLLNKAWTLTLGYETKECLNRPVDDYLHAEDRQAWLNFLEQIHTEKEVSSKELRFHHYSTEIVWLELSARLEAQGEISGSLTNITDRKRAQAALREANEALQMRIQQLRFENLERRQTEATLLESREELNKQKQQLEATLKELKQTQAKLLHAEKMSSLGQLIAGIAHEINNPINFIYGNITHASGYIKDLLELIYLYQRHHSHPVDEIKEKIRTIDLDFLLNDLPSLFSSMEVGVERIRAIVLSLRNFSRLDEAEIKTVDIREGIDSTLMILKHRLKEGYKHTSIQIIQEYCDLPHIECYAGQLNQVFMNLFSNAIDAVISRSATEVSLREISDSGTTEEKSGLSSFIPTIKIYTEIPQEGYVGIRIIDNGTGMSEEIRKKIFDPFFTTKPVGQGTGLGLSISYQIVVEKHRGVLECFSELGKGTEFLIHLPISLPQSNTAF